MVNVHDSTTSQEAVVFLNLEDETIWKYEQLHEVAIRIASALCYRFLNQAIPTRIICNGIDIQTGQSVILPTGTGLRQVNAINEILARIDLTQEMEPCVNQVKRILNEKGNSLPLYVMISNCMKDDLQAAFAELSRTAAASLWIAPLYEDMELHVEAAENMDIIRWEVDKYAA